MKYSFIIILTIIAVAGLILYWPKKAVELPKTNGPIVTTSFYPIYFLTKEIMGDRGSVYNITPAGAEPHDYEPTTKDRIRLEKSNLLIINGGNLEPWGNGVEALLPNTKVLRVGEPLMFEGDPHVWLDPVLYAEEAESIVEALSEIDPAGKKIYTANSLNLLGQINLMDESFRNGLRLCEKNDIITSHAAFAYLARQYGFIQNSIAGLSPDAEPSPAALAAVTQLARAKDIKYIFFESLVSPKLSDAVAREVGAQTLVLNPLEGLSESDLAAGKNFFNEMKNNLNNLRIALVCR